MISTSCRIRRLAGCTLLLCTGTQAAAAALGTASAATTVLPWQISTLGLALLVMILGSLLILRPGRHNSLRRTELPEGDLRNPAPDVEGHPTLEANDSLSQRTEDRRQLEQLQTSLQDMLEQHNFLLNSMPVYIYIEDADDEFRHIYCNAACAAFFQRPVDEIIGKNDQELLGKQEPLDAIRRTNEQIVKDGMLHEDVLPYQDIDGKRHIGRFFRKRLELSNNRRWLCGIVIDITQSEELARNQEVLNRCFADILAAEQQDATPTVLESICSRLDASRCYLIRFDYDAKLYVPVGECLGRSKEHKPLASHPFSPDDTLYRKLLRNGVVCAPDARSPETIHELGLWHDTNEAYDVQSLYCSLVKVNGKPWGYLGITYEKTAQVISDCELEFLTSGAHLTGLMLERRQSQEQLLAGINRLKASSTLMEFGAKLTQSGFFRLNAQTRVIRGTPGLESLYPLHNGVALPMEEWVCPEDQHTVNQTLAALCRGENDQATFRFRSTYFGELRYYQMLLSHDRDSREPQFFGAIQDVSEISRAAARIQESQALWEQVINSIPITFFAKAIDHDLHYVLCNRAFADFLGKTPEQVIGKTDAELFTAPEEEINHYRQRDREAVLKGEIHFEEDSTDVHGNLHRFSTVKKLFVSPNGRRLLLGASSDVTELTAMIRHEQTNNEVLAQAVIEPALRKVIAKISKIVLDTVRADRVFFARVDKNGKLKFCSEHYSQQVAALPENELHVHEALWNTHLQNFRSKETVLYENLAAVPEMQTFLAEHPEYPMRSFAGVPVLIDQEFCGVLMVLFTIPRRLRSSDRNFLRSMANVIALAMIRERQTLALEQAEREKGLIIDNVNIPLILYAPDGRIVRQNASAAQRFGTFDGSVPFHCRAVKRCMIPEMDCPVRIALSDGKPHQYLESWQGHEQVIDARPIFNETGKLVNVIASAFDISKQTQLLRNQAVINDCLANLVREGDMHRAIELSLRSISERVGANHCYIFQFDTARQTIECFAEYADKDELQLFRHLKNRQPYRARPNWEERFAQNHLLSFPDLQNQYIKEGLEGWGEFIIEHQVRSLYAHRILLHDKFWGYIGLLFEHQPKVLTEEEQEFISSVAYCVELMLIRGEYQNRVFSALKQAKDADKAKSMFLASMSHEIRTPLNAVIGFAELLKDSTLPPPEQREYLGSIAAAGNSLLALINDVLDLSKLEAGQLVLSPSDVNFADLLHEVSAIFRQKCAARQISIQEDVAPELPILWIDKLRVRQILFNLIGNAVKFTEHGGITVKVRFLPDNARVGTLSFQVIDTGCGIAEEDQKQLFQMFVQSAALRGTKAADSGTGLGLAICRRLVEQMNGDIQLQSQPGVGSEFSVTLRQIRYGRSPDFPAPAADNPLTPAEFAGLRVLLVDDVTMNLKVMTAMLRRLQIDVRSVGGGKEALAFLAEHKIDAVMTDLWMPEMNGAELAAALRSYPDFHALPIAAVTADADGKANFDLSVFDAVMTKPVTTAKITATLRKLLKKTQLGNG